MEEPHPLDDPVRKARTVRALVVTSPFVFVLCWVLAWAQGAATEHVLLIAGVGFGLCLAAALVIQVMGSKSWMAVVALKILAALVARK